MNAILDVHYRGSVATVACVRFDEWDDRAPKGTRLSSLRVPADYIPGRFYRRELPCLLHALAREACRFDIIVIDAFVHLKAPRIKGLGAHLLAALPYDAAIVGVAKNPLGLADRFIPVLRGRSRKPLYVSAANMTVEEAAAGVRAMAGDYRVPELIKIADRRSRHPVTL